MVNVSQELLREFNMKISNPAHKKIISKFTIMGTIIGRTEVAVINLLRVKLRMKDEFKINYEKLA